VKLVIQSNGDTKNSSPSRPNVLIISAMPSQSFALLEVVETAWLIQWHPDQPPGKKLKIEGLLWQLPYSPIDITILVVLVPDRAAETKRRNTVLLSLSQSMPATPFGVMNATVPQHHFSSYWKHYTPKNIMSYFAKSNFSGGRALSAQLG